MEARRSERRTLLDTALREQMLASATGVYFGQNERLFRMMPIADCLASVLGNWRSSR
jgi:hypothetical protein